MIILVFVILGFVFLVVLFKRRKQKLEINKLQNVKVEEEYIKMKAVTIEKRDRYLNSNSTCTDEYVEINVIPVDGKYTPSPSIPRLAKLSNPMFSEMESNSTYQNIDKSQNPMFSEMESNPMYQNIDKSQNPMSDEMESKPMYQSIDKSHDPPSTTSVPQGTTSDDIYTMPDIIISQTVETDNETVYSEPIHQGKFS